MLPGPAELLLALPWIAAAILIPFLIRRRPWLHEQPPPAADDAPFVSVIIPARNEAANIAGVTATLLTSTYPRFEVILVDDRSTDGTTEIAARLAANHPELIRVVSGEPLPAGWIGKCWACWQGYLAARGDILVFTDADTRHHESLLGHAVGAIRRTGADLVTVFPRQLMFTFWERLVQPHVFTAILMRYRDGEYVNRTRNPRDVIANGQFICFTRDGYEAVGGHEAVRTEIVEDLKLAQRTIRTGRRLYIGWADDLIATRMYRSLRQIVEGWSKNLALAARQAVDPWLRPLLPLLVPLFLIAFWAGPPMTLIASLLRGLPIGWSTTASIAALVFWIWMYRRFSIPVTLACLYPLGAIITATLFIRSALLGEHVTWKGRRYDVSGNGEAAREQPGVTTSSAGD